MRKFQWLKAIVVLQAVCLIALAVFTIVKLMPTRAEPPNGAAAGNNGSNHAGGSGAEQPVAVIGGRTITAGELTERLMEEYGAAALHRLMVREAVQLEAEAYGNAVSPRELEEELAAMMAGYGDEAAFYEAMRVQLGMSPDEVRADAEERLLLEKIAIRPYLITDDEVDAYLREHPELLEPQIRLTLSWIVTEERDEADAVLERLAAGESFEQQARIYSIDHFTAEYGGFLGTVSADDPFLDPAVKDLAASIAVGDIAGPVATADGWAVIRLDGREVSDRPDDRGLREQVRKQLGLAAAPSLREVEEMLLLKYGAEVFDPELQLR